MSLDNCCICADLHLKFIVCPECNIKICSSCYKRYLLESTSDIPMCMGCKKSHTIEFVKSNTSEIFMKQYHHHRAEIFLQNEKSYIPITMGYVETEKKLLELNRELKTLLSLEKVSTGLEKHTIKYQIRQLRLHINDLKNIKPYVSTLTQMIKCPTNLCKGVIGENYTCPVCSVEICEECHNIPNGSHVCKTEDIESIQMISKSTKNCPKCMVPIHKIDGCNQIWCVSCHIAFDYRTGEIETKIHNPHYYEWMRNNNIEIPREEGDGNMPMHREFNAGIIFAKLRGYRRRIEPSGAPQTYYEINKKFREFNLPYETIIPLVYHIENVMIPRYSPNREKLQEYRINFILNVIDEKKWLSLLKRYITANEKKTEILITLRNLASKIAELLLFFQNSTISKEELEDSLVTVKNSFNSKKETPYILDSEWKLIKPINID